MHVHSTEYIQASSISLSLSLSDGWMDVMDDAPAGFPPTPCHSTRSDTKISRLLLSLAHAASMIVGRSSETEEDEKVPQQLYSSETASFLPVDSLEGFRSSGRESELVTQAFPSRFILTP